MKKLLALLLVMIMCCFLVACGSRHDTSSGNQPQIDENTTPNIVEIELTAENFDTYFEFVEIAFFSENAFGEADEMDLSQFYLVREEYTVSDASTLAIEYTRTWGSVICDVDFVNQTFVLGDIEDKADPSIIIDDSCSLYRDIGGKDRYGFSVGAISQVSKDSGNNIMGYNFDFEILRATGTLYLIED